MKKNDNQSLILLSLSEEIVRIRGKQDMLDIIINKLKKHILFDDSFILRYNKNTRTCRPYIYTENTRSDDPQYKTFLDLEYPVADDSVKEINYPQLYDVATLLPLGIEKIDFLHNSGVKEFVVVKLIEGNELKGLFILLSEKTDSFKPEDLDLLHRLSFQISAATANIIANEEIAKREEEKSTLISLTSRIAAVRNKNELLRLLNDKLIDLFPIRGFGITLINSNGITHSPFVVDVHDELKEGNDFKEAISLNYSISDGVFNVIISADDPVTLQVDELARMDEAPAYVEFWKKMDVKEVVGNPIRVGANNLGCFILLHDYKSSQKINSNLFKGVCAQVSIAISHIIANDEIAKREEEKTMLVSLSEEIAILNTRNDLLQIVNERVKKIFSIAEFAIAKINEDGATYSAFMLDLEDRITHDADFKEVTSEKYEVTDLLFNKVINSEDPVIFNVNEITEIPGMPAFVHFWKKVGLQQVLCAALKAGGKNIGMAVLHIDTNPSINPKSILLKGICAQLSVAISNILGNENIKKAGQEKSLLLSFCNDIATVRDKNGLRLIIKQYLKNIFHINEYILTTPNSDGETYSHFMHDSNADDPTDDGWKTMLGNRIPVKGAFIGAVLQSEEAVFDIDEIIRENQFYFPAASFWKAAGAKKVMGFRLKVAYKDVGLLVIQPGQINNQLLKGISAQLAIAIANIVAIEEIQTREEEKSRLLDFSNAMASSQDKAVLGRIITRQLKEILNTRGHYMLYALSEDKLTYYPFLFDPDSSPANLSKDPSLETTIRTNNRVNDGILKKILSEGRPILFNIEERFVQPPTPAYMKMMEERNVRKITGAPIRLDNTDIGVILFDTNNEPLGSTEKLFNSILSQIAITVSNLIAAEKVLNQLVEIKQYKQLLEEEKTYLREEIETSQNFSELIGESDEMKKIFRLVQQVASSDSTVLVLGETGTGKELIARAIHNASPRKSKLMVKVNCAAIPANLIESELFGHERGSFTGATERRIGKFELAHNGTLFLDEIGEMPLELQVKLLRVLQEKEIERVGGKMTIKVDVRIIAATNRDLEKYMEEGKFRSDLYYRLNIFPISLSPLRDRKEDIPALAQHFVKRFSKKAGKKIFSISNKALQELTQYNWPGNIRELEHFIERSVLLANNGTIKEIHLPTSLKNLTGTKSMDDIPVKTIDEIERDYILKVLKYVKGKISGEGGAAELLGIPPSTLHSRMKRLGIRKEHSG
ncbi:sigma-54-dependent Fis family transcriptional regulator [Lacibacter sediminis]|nr:sigma 54-interacting transcriptional regulator [Lacibacter sediminis]